MTAVALVVASTVTSVSLVVPAVTPLEMPERETGTSTALVLIRSRWMYEHDLIAEARARHRSGVGRRGSESRPLSPRLVGPTSTDVLERIARCESGGSYTAENPTSSASGIAQWLDGTWNNEGGYSHASDAPPEVQDRRFREDIAQGPAYVRQTWAASRGCWN